MITLKDFCQMQKIISYLYPNRIELLIGLTGFSVEYTNVYQRNLKIYKGIDNTIEFDIKNADQKRVDLSTLDDLSLNIMDVNGNALPNNPYLLTVTTLKGIATITIPKEDLAYLDAQFLKYSVSAIKDTQEVILYCDSHFGAVGMLELVGDAMPVSKPNRVFDTFTGEIDYTGNVLNHCSAIPATFYEAIPTTRLSFDIDCKDFVGSIYLEATTDDTISVESFRHSPQIQTWSTTTTTTTTVTFSNIVVGDYKYFRVVWHNPIHGFFYGSQSPYNVGFTNTAGVVNKVTVY